MKLIVKTLLACALLLPFVVAADDSGHLLSMWQVQGERNRVYLLGSIHLLRETDHPLPTAIFDAYADAESLVMELDMDDMDPVEGQLLANELGLIQDTRTLADLMGADLYAQAMQKSAAVDVPLAMLDRAEPWYAAMNVELMLLMRMGFNPAHGIETHLLELAKRDGKEIEGFETIREQFEFLDGLSPDAQREMLMQALDEGASMQEMMNSMIAAWRVGDLDFMEKNMLSEMEKYPELNRVIVTDRNHNWVDRIEELLDDEDDYLIVVGTLHLIGDQGVPELLGARGFDIRQLRQEAGN